MPQPYLESNHKASVLSKLALKQLPYLSNISKHLSNDTGASSKVSEASSAYWIAEYSDSLNIIPQIVGTF
jgi:hypothetical protein